ncbi:unnamed protein product [Amoebophrya sp. A25]|nr:unnamed protein product [Amoebophrya sp. A25]|eukprot:GSA25T00018660001.1
MGLGGTGSGTGMSPIVPRATGRRSIEQDGGFEIVTSARINVLSTRPRRSSCSKISLGHEGIETATSGSPTNYRHLAVTSMRRAKSNTPDKKAYLYRGVQQEGHAATSTSSSSSSDNWADQHVSTPPRRKCCAHSDASSPASRNNLVTKQQITAPTTTSSMSSSSSRGECEKDQIIAYLSEQRGRFFVRSFDTDILSRFSDDTTFAEDANVVSTRASTRAAVIADALMESKDVRDELGLFMAHANRQSPHDDKKARNCGGTDTRGVDGKLRGDDQDCSWDERGLRTGHSQQEAAATSHTASTGSTSSSSNSAEDKGLLQSMSTMSSTCGRKRADRTIASEDIPRDTTQRGEGYSDGWPSVGFFRDLKEAPVSFLPTYKLVGGGQEFYNSERVPSWCDRVLYYTSCSSRSACTSSSGGLPTSTMRSSAGSTTLSSSSSVGGCRVHYTPREYFALEKTKHLFSDHRAVVHTGSLSYNAPAATARFSDEHRLPRGDGSKSSKASVQQGQKCKGFHVPVSSSRREKQRLQDVWGNQRQNDDPLMNGQRRILAAPKTSQSRVSFVSNANHGHLAAPLLESSSSRSKDPHLKTTEPLKKCIKNPRTESHNSGLYTSPLITILR